MVDVTFKSRAAHHVPLSLFKRVASLSSDEPPDDVAYIGKDGVQAIKSQCVIAVWSLVKTKPGFSLRLKAWRSSIVAA